VGLQYVGQNGAEASLDDIHITADGGDGFDSQFNGSAEDWESHSGRWYVESNYLWTYGLADTSASASHTAEFANFEYEVRMRRYGCETCANGLYVRGTPLPLTSDNHWYHEYKFQYDQDGNFSVYKRIAGGSAQILQSWTFSSAINQGDAWNVLRVVANGTSLSFYINGTPVWSGSDSSLAAGQVGVGMYRNLTSIDLLEVDWATLSPLSGAEVEVGAVSAEQQALNDAANRRGGGSEDQAPVGGKGP
jgi:hypothetical protein